MRQFTRQQSTPVLAKGATYDGWVADALAAPAVCWNPDDGVFAMTVSFWDDTAGEWASGFFTSTDLVTWGYVSGSLKTPTGSNYILGNAGLEYFEGEYWFAYNEYETAPNNRVKVSHSTDLVSWTDLGAVSVGPTAQADPSLRVNPTSGLLELWLIDQSDRSAWMLDSPDGSAWTSRGQFLDGALPYDTNFGEPDVFYLPGDAGRYMLYDGAVESGRRHLFLAYSAGQDTSWETLGSVLGPSAVNSWENVNTFDAACAGVFDVGDGDRIYLLYAGGDVVAATDDTSSSIGLAWVASGGRSPSAPRRRPTRFFRRAW